MKKDDMKANAGGSSIDEFAARERVQASAKMKYQTPKLQVYGSVTELTHGVGGTKGDGTSGQTRLG
ncbi:MAG: lasso RiPP family leader peptide-containing protein [Pseudorhodoplanes sp.]